MRPISFPFFPLQCKDVIVWILLACMLLLPYDPKSQLPSLRRRKEDLAQPRSTGWYSNEYQESISNRALERWTWCPKSHLHPGVVLRPQFGKKKLICSYPQCVSIRRLCWHSGITVQILWKWLQVLPTLRVLKILLTDSREVFIVAGARARKLQLSTGSVSTALFCLEGLVEEFHSYFSTTTWECNNYIFEHIFSFGFQETYHYRLKKP